LQQLVSQQAALVAAAAQGSTFLSPVAALSSPHVTVGSLTAMANGALPQPAAAAAATGNGISSSATAAGQSTHLRVSEQTRVFATKQENIAIFTRSRPWLVLSGYTTCI